LKFRMTDAMELFDETFRGASIADQPIQLQLCRDGGWLGFDAWPPPAERQVWHLRADGALSREPAGDEAADGYVYDPEDPTPSIGGTTLGKGSGPKDQVQRESRADVLTYTTPAFEHDVRVVGDLSCALSLQTSTAHSDVFVRLCHVDAKGVSTNLADGILKLTPANGLGVAGTVRVVPVDMFPVGVLVKAGERLRLQVSNGAHPLYARNWGTGEPLAKAAGGVACEVRVLHDAAHPSTITLPVLPA
jgi:putative CocE/NonD family hydrolase